MTDLQRRIEEPGTTGSVHTPHDFPLARTDRAQLDELLSRRRS
jgi:hypothetical protein